MMPEIATALEVEFISRVESGLCCGMSFVLVDLLVATLGLSTLDNHQNLSGEIFFLVEKYILKLMV